jgi:hypothetical protein
MPRIPESMLAALIAELKAKGYTPEREYIEAEIQENRAKSGFVP